MESEIITLLGVNILIKQNYLTWLIFVIIMIMPEHLVGEETGRTKKNIIKDVMLWL